MTENFKYVMLAVLAVALAALVALNLINLINFGSTTDSAKVIVAAVATGQDVPDEEFDRPDADGESALERTFWFSIYSLFAGEPIPGSPRTIAGRLIVRCFRNRLLVGSA